MSQQTVLFTAKTTSGSECGHEELQADVLLITVLCYMKMASANI
jgi:hypothetical protein